MRTLIGEFKQQAFTQIIFPHKETDWNEYLEEAEQTFINIINTISIFQPCVVICSDINYVKKYFKDSTNIIFKQYTTNDTWARDCSAISILENKKIKLLNFTFNGWGEKFSFEKDNALTPTLYKEIENCNLILEGGAIESNNEGIILTTSHAMLNKNRNKNLTKTEITQKLKECFGAKEILYLNHGYLAGDDTDSHIDTLARFINENTIMYVTSDNQQDEHFQELSLMKQELEHFASLYNFKLIPLPMCSPIYFNGERLPATYANFLFVNNAILVPIYNVKEDKIALSIFQENFPQHQIISIDCSTLIKQHGSLHCVTMNFAQA